MLSVLLVILCVRCDQKLGSQSSRWGHKLTTRRAKGQQRKLNK